MISTQNPTGLNTITPYTITLDRDENWLITDVAASVACRRMARPVPASVARRPSHATTCTRAARTRSDPVTPRRPGEAGRRSSLGACGRCRHVRHLFAASVIGARQRRPPASRRRPPRTGPRRECRRASGSLGAILLIIIAALTGCSRSAGFSPATGRCGRVPDDHVRWRRWHLSCGSCATRPAKRRPSALRRCSCAPTASTTTWAVGRTFACFIASTLVGVLLIRDARGGSATVFARGQKWNDLLGQSRFQSRGSDWAQRDSRGRPSPTRCRPTGRQGGRCPGVTRVPSRRPLNSTRPLPGKTGEGGRNRIGEIDVEIDECGGGAAGGLVCGIIAGPGAGTARRSLGRPR